MTSLARNALLPRVNVAWFAAATATAAGAQPLEPPGLGEQLDTRRTVREWVLAGEIGDRDGIPAVGFAALTLRLDGRVLGRGEAATLDPGPDTVAEAAREAIGEARTGIARMAGPLVRDAWTRGAGELSIELSLGGRLVPLTDEELRLAQAERATGLSGLAVRAGHEGVAVVRGERVLASGPGFMLERGLSAGEALAALAGEALDSPAAALRDLDDLEREGLAFYRFRAGRIADVGDPSIPVPLYRDGTVVEPREVDRELIEQTAAALAAHLIARRWPGVEPYGLRGGAEIHRWVFDERAAPAFDQALAVGALLAFDRVRPDGAVSLRPTALEILRELAVTAEQETDPSESAVEAAATLVVLSSLEESELDADLRALAAHCGATLEGAFDPSRGYARSIPEPAKGLVALAKVRRGDPDAALAVARVYRDTGAERAIAQMPFLAWASIEQSQREGGPVAAGVALRELRDLVGRFGIGRADIDGLDRDLLGGVVFTRGRQPLPTWQTARASGMTAAMLADPSLTMGDLSSGELPGRLVEHLATTRFLIQLACRDAEVHSARIPGRARGAVRVSPWSREAPLAANALVLWSLAETLRTLEILASGR